MYYIDGADSQYKNYKIGGTVKWLDARDQVVTPKGLYGHKDCMGIFLGGKEETETYGLELASRIAEAKSVLGKRSYHPY